jgi:diguanylate cyclase (GGDEF)-like protein
MIKLGLRSGAANESPLRAVVDELLALLVDVISAYHEAGDLEIVEGLESRRRELAEAADDETLAMLAESCLEAARAAVTRACGRQSEQHAELTRFVALVRDTVTVLGGQEQDPSSEINQAADRFNELLEIKDFGQLKSRLEQEVTQLRRLAEERQRQWRDATEMFMAKVAVLETQLAGVREEASLDPLTKIGNRRHLESSLAEHLLKSRRQFVVALFDLDRFKQINDTHSHGMGDRVLQETALALKTSMRPGDLVARIDGDEFAAIAPGMTLKQSEARMQSVLTSIAGHLREVKDLVPVSLSCGVAECSAGDTAQSLIGRADQALYEAKRRGKNRIAIKAVPFIRELLSR